MSDVIPLDSARREKTKREKTERARAHWDRIRIQLKPSLIETTPSYLHRIIEATEDCFAQMQRAAKLRDWKAFERLKADHHNLCQQWQELVS